MSEKVPDTIGVYRITHIDNLQTILQKGIFAANFAPDDASYKFIADRDLTDRRKDKPIPLEGHSVLGDYVPFYFGERSPMLYTIHRKMPTSQEEVIYLLVKLESLTLAGCAYCFTDGHASQQMTKFFTATEDLERLDWATIKSRNWRNTDEDNDRKRRKSAELLVLKHVPPQCIDYIVTFDEQKANKIRKIVLDLGLNTPCSAQKDKFYY